ncbi:YeeE/YedE family protein [bacterium]|nr:YeeE/YedE family protein [bacterium]
MRQQQLSALVCGLLFAIGLGVSGMTQPQKVIGFLNIFGAWDPSLLFVMVGGVLVYGLGYPWVKKAPKPLFAPQFLVPTSRHIDKRLLVGAALFGIGWGIAGFCPGPALASLVTLGRAPLIFGIFMILTVLIFERIQNKKERVS